MELSKLSPSQGARKNRKRVGRGNASGWGRTSGRGEKGQLARSGGKSRIGFEGGQMPLYRRVPKYGFRSMKKLLGLNCYQVVSLDKLESFDDGGTVDLQALEAIGIVPGAKQKSGVKVLGGQLTKKLNLKVNAISKTAQAKIEELGGSVEIVQDKEQSA